MNTNALPLTPSWPLNGPLPPCSVEFLNCKDQPAYSSRWRRVLAWLGLPVKVDHYQATYTFRVRPTIELGPACHPFAMAAKTMDLDPDRLEVKANGTVWYRD